MPRYNGPPLDLHALTERVRHLEAELRSRSQASTDEKRRHDATLVQLAELQRMLREQGASLESKVEAVRREGKQREDVLRGELQAAQGQKEALHAQVAGMQQALDRLEAAQRVAGSERHALSVATAQISGMQQGLAVSEERATATQHTLSETTASLALLQQRHAALATAATADQSSLTSLAAEIRNATQDLSAETEAAKARLEALQAMCERLEKQARRSRRSTRQHDVQLRDLTDFVEARAAEARGSSAQLRAGLNETRATLSEWSAGLTALGSDIYESRERSSSPTCSAWAGSPAFEWSAGSPSAAGRLPPSRLKRYSFPQKDASNSSSEASAESDSQTEA